MNASDEVFEAMGRLDRIARSLQTGGRQTVRIGVVQALAFEVVPSAISTLLNQTDDYSFHIQTGTQGELNRELKSGLLDAIVMFGVSVDPELDNQQVGECRGVIVMNREMAQAQQDKEMRLSDLPLVDILGSGPLVALSQNSCSQPQ